MPDEKDITTLLGQAACGDRDAVEQLFVRVEQDLRMARKYARLGLNWLAEKLGEPA